MLAVLGLTIAVAVGVIPAAVGASSQSPTAAKGDFCRAKGVERMAIASAPISLTAKGKGSNNGAVTTCAVKMKGNWAKNSATFSIDATGAAKLGKGGAFTLDPKTNLKPFTGKVTGTLTGGGLGPGTDIVVHIHCWYSYPPLRYGCEIIISPSPSGAPRAAVHAVAPQITTGTVLCSATGVKPGNNTGVVNVSVKGKGTSGTGTPVTCAGKVTGTWKKNSTTFSTDASASTTLGAKGAFSKKFSGPLMASEKAVGTLTGSGLGTGSNITIDVGCSWTYPPLKVKCWIIVSAA